MKREPLSYQEHRELGERLKALESECSDITELLSCRISTNLAAKFLRATSRFWRFRDELEKVMVRESQKSGQRLPEDWGLCYYGPSVAEVAAVWSRNGNQDAP